MRYQHICKSYQWVTSILESIGSWFPYLMLRFILAWEFGEAGLAKLNGENSLPRSLSHFLST